MILQHQNNTVNVYDFDDNIKITNGVIKVKDKSGNIIEWSTKDYKEKSKLIGTQYFWLDEKNIDLSLKDFRDVKEGNFKKQIMEAVNGPMYNKFKFDIIHGNIFAILTSRGHSEKNMIDGFLHYINTNFSKNEKKQMITNISWKYRLEADNKDEKDIIRFYLEQNYYYNINSTEFEERLDGNKNNFSDKKTIGMRDLILKINNKFSDEINGKNLKIHFSEDDPKNIEKMKEFFLGNHYYDLIEKPNFKSLEIKLINTDNPKRINNTTIYQNKGVKGKNIYTQNELFNTLQN